MPTGQPYDAAALQKQPQVLGDLLRSLDTARKCSSLYGADHSNAIEAFEGLLAALEEFGSAFERATCIFGDNEVIINDRIFRPSTESREISRRLRARGVMAVTFAGAASVEEIGEFLGFLSAEPREIRREGSPSVYLRTRGVLRIVATDALYSTGEDSPEGIAPERSSACLGDVDRAIAAAIDWLSKQDEGGEKCPRLPIAQILSQPDMAARLIREAVTKLHASRRGSTDGELATEVIHDLKGLAANESEDWDSAAPQIRRAIAKLPSDMLPAASGFSVEPKEPGDDASSSATDVDEVEMLVAAELRRQGGSDQSTAIDISPIEHLFGATATGLLSNWRKELLPKSVILSSGGTLDTLMIWEDSPAEHARIAQALAAMISRAIAMSDVSSAVMFAQDLVKEADRRGEEPWRSANAIAALRSVEVSVLQTAVDGALASREYWMKETAAALVGMLPNLALACASMLGRCEGELFGESLRKGIVGSGQSALSVILALVHNGPATSREAALGLLAEISWPAAIGEIASIVRGPDDNLAACALAKLAGNRTSEAVAICVEGLSHRDERARVAAICSLGEIGGDTALDHLVRIAKRRSPMRDNTPERIAAVRAMARLGRPEAIAHLEAIAGSTPLFGRGRYEAVKVAAIRELEQAGRSAPHKAA